MFYYVAEVLAADPALFLAGVFPLFFYFKMFKLFLTAYFFFFIA
jgi:hypothetical protein